MKQIDNGVTFDIVVRKLASYLISVIFRLIVGQILSIK